MNKKLLFLISVSLCFSLKQSLAQYNLDYGVRVGVANYLGDIGGELEDRKPFIYDLKLAKTRPTISVFARYKLHPLFGAKVSLNYLQIAGDDKLSDNMGRKSRNLSFRTDIVDLSALGEFYFFEINDLGRTYRYRNDFRAYFYTGVCAFWYQPQAKYNGEWYRLRKLQTEGPSNAYGPISFATPLGIGFYFTIEKKYRIGWELDWRKTFTDYLDDISTVYADTSLFTDPIARALANRRDELPAEDDLLAHPANYSPGNKRGDPSKKDAYLFSTINFSYVIRGKSGFYRSKYGSVFKGKKYRKRRVRAKF
ncbi:MAG: hypothetical protein J0M08_06415 [Bacteroidetes bacterium]|nr:hypothetical protein [Bacteroidota bacterium]